MGNYFVKKAMTSTLGFTDAQADSVLRMASSFKGGEIDRDLAMKLFDKFSTKSPQEINTMLRYIDENF